MLKEDFLRKLNGGIVVSVSIFLVSIGAFFFISFQSSVSAVGMIIDALQISGQDNVGIALSLRELIANINTLFITQLATFVIAIVALLYSIWYTTQRYLIEKKNALVDGLTGLYNKKAILFHLNQEILRSKRYNHPTTVAILDIDFFKKYNDSNGHLAGDRLLTRFATILKEHLRQYDEVGRFGGEEFVIVFPETDIKDAYIICERIRREVEKTPFYGKENMPLKRVTVSIGLSEIKGGKDTEDILLHKADVLLYKAKESGRNQVRYE